MAEVKFALFDTPIGSCGIAWSGKGIVALQLPEASKKATRARITQLQPGAVESDPPAKLRKTITTIGALLDGKQADLGSATLDMEGVPPFHCRVYQAAREIAPGETLSYGAIAARIGSPGSARAVGQALGRNPFALIVPCHRVVAANGKIGGFSANGGVTTKAHLLSLEHPPVGIDLKKALAHLHKVDPKLGHFIDRAGAFGLQINPADSVFGMLAEAIVYQQLTAKAAATIFGRVCDACANGKRPKPRDVLSASIADLRGAGLSQAKTLALRDLAEKADSGELPTLAKIRQLPDDDIIETLTKVRGVGRWTAEMFLIFRLGRPDVLPMDDYGLRRGYATVFGKKDLPGKADLEKAGTKWAPYRTVASWYLWKAAEPPRLDK